MMAPDTVIPMRMMRELDRLRAAAALTETDERRENLDPRVSKSIDQILQASELIKDKSTELERTGRMISELKISNAQLVSRCTEAHTALKEFKDQLQTQISRAESAEALVLHLENQLRATENAKRETQFNLSRLTQLIEQSLPTAPSPLTSESVKNTTSVA